MVSGAPFQAGKLIPVSDLNKKTISHTESLSTEIKLPGSVWYNLVNNGAFLKDDVVAWNADEDGYVYLSMAKHTHNDDTNASGGSLKDIFADNLTKFLYFYKRMGLSVSDFYSSGSGGTAAYDTTKGAIELDAPSTNNYRYLSLPGIPMTFTEDSVVESDLQYVGAITANFARFGVAMETLNLTNSSDEKYGIESCAATNGNWFLVTADGSNRTQQDSLKPLDGDDLRQTYRLENTVGVSVDFTYSDDTAVSKSTNLPIENTTPATNIVNYGVKSTNTSGKQLYIWGLAVVGEK